MKEFALLESDLSTHKWETGVTWRGTFIPQVEVVSLHRILENKTPQVCIAWIKKDLSAVQEHCEQVCAGGSMGVVKPPIFVPKSDGYVIASMIVPLPEDFDLEELRNPT